MGLVGSMWARPLLPTLDFDATSTRLRHDFDTTSTRLRHDFDTTSTRHRRDFDTTLRHDSSTRLFDTILAPIILITLRVSRLALAAVFSYDLEVPSRGPRRYFHGPPSPIWVFLPAAVFISGEFLVALPVLIGFLIIIREAKQDLPTIIRTDLGLPEGHPLQRTIR